MAKHYDEIDSYTATRDAALKKIKNAAEDSELEILEEIAEEVDPKKRRERESNCQAAHMVVDKCLNAYRDGEYSFDVTVDMISKALKALK